MRRIKLLQGTTTKTLHMVLEDMQTAVLEIEAAANENPNLAPANTPQEEAMLEIVIAREESKLEEINDVVESSLPAVGVLEDTAYGIAPAIKNTQATDIALVRQIAITTADALGIPSEELTRDADAAVIGEPLVLEAFKEKAIAAARGIWNAILNILDKVWTVIQSSFRQTAGRLKKLKDITKHTTDWSKEVTIKPTASMVSLVTGNTIHPVDIVKGIDGFIKYMELASTNMRMAASTYGRMTSVIDKVKTAEDIPRIFNEAALLLLNGFAAEINGNEALKVDGGDIVTVYPLNGSYIRLDGMATVSNLLKKDPMQAASVFSSVNISFIDSKQTLTEDTLYTAESFGILAEKLDGIFRWITPETINHVGGITRETKRNVQSMADKVLANWATVIDKAPAEQQTSLRPYLSAVSQLVNKHARLTTILYTKGIHALDTAVTACTQLLEQGVGAGKESKALNGLPPFVQKAISSGKINTIRSSILAMVDNNRYDSQQLTALIKQVEVAAPSSLYKPYEETTVSRAMNKDTGVWSKEYYLEQVAYSNMNFSKERVEHIVNVRNYLRQENVAGFEPA